MGLLQELSDKIGIVTSTLYRPDSESDALRSSLAKETAKRATDLGYQLFVVDGGSTHEFLKEMENYGAKIIQLSATMGAQRRAIIQAAGEAGKEIIAWTEPEKFSYVSEIAKIAQPILDGSADLVVPRRKDLYSYPTAQQNAEPLGNAFWKALTGYDLDVWFGPRTWRREISDYFLNYRGEYGDRWESLYIPLLDMIFDHKKITEVLIDYKHPKNQTELEDKSVEFYKKRLVQLNNLIPALETHWKKLHNK